MEERSESLPEPGFYWAREKSPTRRGPLEIFRVIDDGGYFTGSLIYVMLNEVEIKGPLLVPPRS